MDSALFQGILFLVSLV